MYNALCNKNMSWITALGFSRYSVRSPGMCSGPNSSRIQDCHVAATTPLWQIFFAKTNCFYDRWTAKKRTNRSNDLHLIHLSNEILLGAMKMIGSYCSCLKIAASTAAFFQAGPMPSSCTVLKITCYQRQQLV